MDIAERFFQLWTIQGVSLIAGTYISDPWIKKEVQVFHNSDDIACIAFAIGYTRTSYKPSVVVLEGTSCSADDLNMAIKDAWHLPIFFLFVTPIVNKITLPPNLEILTTKSTFPKKVNSMIVAHVPIQKIRNSLYHVLYTEDDKIITENAERLKFFASISRRPVILLGEGLDSTIIKTLPEKTPIVVTPSSLDFISSDSKYFMGRFGIDGDRSGNFVVQNADLIIILGFMSLTTNPQYFAREAHVVWIHNTDNNSNFHYTIHYKTLTIFNHDLNSLYRPEWISTCMKWKSLWMGELPIVSDTLDTVVHPYIFQCLIHDVFSIPKTIITRTDDLWWIPVYQQNIIRQGDRFIPTKVLDILSFSAGVYSVISEQPILIFMGDKNCFRLQDLQYISQNNIPLLIFCMNPGYSGFIIDDQGFLQRSDKKGCLSLEQIGQMTGIRTTTIINDDIMDQLNYFHQSFDTILIDVLTIKDFVPFPFGSDSFPPEEMLPLLNQGVFDHEMVIRPISRNLFFT